MIDVFKGAETLENDNLHSSRVKLGGQKGQSCLQDNVNMISLTDRSFDVDKCAYCKHRLFISVYLDTIQITRFNSKVQKSHEEKMKVWNGTQTKKRGIKPRPNKSISQHLAFLCCKMNCVDRCDDSG